MDLATGLRRAGIDVELFGGRAAAGVTPLNTPTRTDRFSVDAARTLRHLGGWRYGFASPYEAEQTVFSLALWRRIHRSFDILHVQDPTIAIWFERARRLGLSRTQVVYANGTGENADVMRRFRWLQLLTAQAHDKWTPPLGQSVFMIPNFIDTAVFSPGQQGAARHRLGLPQGPKIVLCCAAIRRYHKRIDVLLQEFAQFSRGRHDDWLLVIAGGRETDTDELIAAGSALLGDKVRFLPSLPRALMPDLYRAADVFALASLFEMFGIVLLEAMASGLPVLCHDSPAFRSIVGPAGCFRDLSVDGGIAAGLAALADPGYATGLAAAARRQVVERFSETVVISDVIAMYETVLRG